MSGKKKLLYALSTLALVVVVAAASVGITFAALSATVKSTFKITYNALNVNATVEASYQVKNLESKTIGTATFSQTTDTNASVSKDLNVKEEQIELTAANNYVDLVYKFTNTDEHNDLKISLNAAPTGATGLTIYYSKDNSNFESTDVTTVKNITVDAGGTNNVTLVVRFQISDNNNSVTAEGIALTWDLSSVAHPAE